MSRFALTRRSALALVGGAAAFGLGHRAAHAAGEIKVLNWQGYGTDEKWAVEMFEKKTGIKVVHDYFNSEQEMLTKLRTSPGVYDVVLMNNIYVMEAAHEGLIQPLDTAKFSNFNDLTPALRDSDRFVMDGKHYAIAWVWGLTSFAYNTEKIKTKPDTMEALWDPAHAGKVGWRDDALESIQIAALATGQDMNARLVLRGEEREEEAACNVLGILNEVNKANGEITVTFEVRELAGGKPSEVRVLYVGLAQAYYVSASGEAGIGRPSPAGWVWEPSKAVANDVLTALEIVQGKHTPAFVPLPVKFQ